MGQNLVQGLLRHVQLFPDRGQRNFGLLKIDGCPPFADRTSRKTAIIKRTPAQFGVASCR